MDFPIFHYSGCGLSSRYYSLSLEIGELLLDFDKSVFISATHPPDKFETMRRDPNFLHTRKQ